MTAKMRIFDAHHHLWSLTRCHYPWLMAKGVKRFFGDPAPIQEDYLVHNFRTDATAFDLIGSAHIQVGVNESDIVNETAWLQACSDADGLPSAIVGYADLTADTLTSILDAHAAYLNFRGVRQIVGRHPVEDEKTGSGALLNDPRFAAGLEALARRGLRFELQLVASQYEATFDALTRIRELPVAICHFASPWDQSPDAYRHWRDAMARFAELPNCHMKLSGFGMFKPDWTYDDIAPYVNDALTLFGAQRCMAGSNFPVDKLYGDYTRFWRALVELIPDKSALQAVTLDNAMRYYDVPAPVS